MLCHYAIHHCTLHCVWGARSGSICKRGITAHPWGLHVMCLLDNLQRLLEEQYLPREMFPAQRWKADGLQPSRCPPLAASITHSHALAQLLNPATQTDRQDNICLPHEKVFFFFACTSKYATCFVD